MRQVTRMHRTLTVLAVGLLALAAPLVAMANNGRASRRLALPERRPRGPLSAGLGSARASASASSMPRTRVAPTTLPFCSYKAAARVNARAASEARPATCNTSPRSLSTFARAFNPSVEPASIAAASASGTACPTSPR